MRTKLLALSLTFGTIFLISNCYAQANKEVIVTLKEFYKNYITTVASSISNEKQIEALRKKYCTKALLDKIKKETESQELDSDPFLKAQDANAEDTKSLSVIKVPQKENEYIVSYIDSYSHEKTIIHLSVIKQNERHLINAVW